MKKEAYSFIDLNLSDFAMSGQIFTMQIPYQMGNEVPSLFWFLERIICYLGKAPNSLNIRCVFF